ncbi:GNAT family N-acetyltransferase [Pseudohoeflea coraliihabitans]|uniref:GNAT family N-acetyltransferase n=1 Tax=Pseudohoeflea coraliihabitans TaxID=2860393 RepID=A0ABS6WKL6_9HYPH|nr:GNAT family N-acetyltransferase [Pseudohoeflea sp. DP4N28-3]MBW3096488.1 GNAT family N-acetyltransferase [Pseudohoeflea sp. DP4N28-3]
MASKPVVDDHVGSQANTLLGELASMSAARPVAELEIDVGREGRQLVTYNARAGYSLRTELDHLTNRVVEPNVFFSARFLAPAMPRLDDRQVRLLLIRDENARSSRMRLMMPFSIEKPGLAVGPNILRAWANPFGPLGTPLLDAEGGAETLDNLLEGLARPGSGFPEVLVLPDVRMQGPVISLLRAVAIDRNLPISETGFTERPMLESNLEADDYLAAAIGKNHRREMRRQWRRLSERGTLSYVVARQPDEVRHHLEEFLTLEDSGWKGRQRTAMVADRYRAAFAREAINGLAEHDAVRIHTLLLDDEPIASMIVFIASGEAYTWKTAYNEEYASYSPGKLLVEKLTEWHLDDPNISRTDSCAVPDHPVMSRLWSERMRMGTLIIGLRPNSDREVRQVSATLHIYKNTRNMARLIRQKIRGLAARRRP